MRAIVTTAKYTIRWAHFNVDGRKLRNLLRSDERIVHGRFSRKVHTVCELEGANRAGIGAAYLNPMDEFDIEKGRKISLARALDTARLSKKARTLVWKQYLARR